MSRYGALWLPDWDERSVWGWDERGGTYFAELWHNGNRNDSPQANLNWLTLRREIDSPQLLACLIGWTTGIGTADAMDALRATPGLETGRRAAGRGRGADLADAGLTVG